MAKNNKNNDKDVELNRMLSMATISSGTVEYTNNKVGGLKKKMVDSIMRMIGTSISPDTKTILDGLGVDASIKKTIDRGLVVTELYLRDKNVKGSKRVKVRTSYENDYEAMRKDMFTYVDKDTLKKNAKEISTYLNETSGMTLDEPTGLFSVVRKLTNAEHKRALISEFLIMGASEKEAKEYATKYMKKISEREKQMKALQKQSKKSTKKTSKK